MSTTTLAVLCAAPAVLTGCLLLADSVARIAGDGLLWPAGALTLSEAVILGNAGEAEAQLQAGADPNEATRVSIGASGGTPPLLTPLEAGVRSGDVRLIELVLSHGAHLDEESARHLAAVADRIGEQQIAAWLRELAPRSQ